jgi:hypothetical protein
MAGSFLLYDPLNTTPRGALGGSPVVNQSGQVGGSLSIRNCSNSVTGWLKAGDYIQLGSVGSATLHKVLTDVDTNASGQATIDLWPYVRTAPTDGDDVITSNCVGRFRLNSGQQDWTINSASIYGITFAALEVVP